MHPHSMNCAYRIGEKHAKRGTGNEEEDDAVDGERMRVPKCIGALSYSGSNCSTNIPLCLIFPID